MVVVAPLVALMVDQVQSLRAKGVEAAIVSSGGREGRVAGDLLASDFQSLISSSLALIEVSVELCQGTRQIPHWSPWSSSNSCSQVATLQCSHAGLKEAAIVSSGGREGRVAGDLLASDFQSLISSSLALIEVSVELCQGTRQIPHWSPWSSSNSCSQVATLQCSHAGLKNILLRF